MEIKDNTGLLKKHQEETEKNVEVCRICGSKEIHSFAYDIPTMRCVNYLKSRLKAVETAVKVLDKVGVKL